MGTRNWAMIASFLPGRLGRMCRDHWFSVLNPGIKKADWSIEEDAFIAGKFLEIGPKWVQIS